MLRTKSLRAALFLPAAAVVAFANLASSSYAAPSDDLLSFINGRSTATPPTPGTNPVPDSEKNAGFADQRNVNGTSTSNATLANAPADDIVYAVYEASVRNPAQAAEYVNAAVTAGRRDINLIVGRIVDAAIFASGPTVTNESVADIVRSAATPTVVSPVGKARAVAQALGTAPGAGTQIANVAATPAVQGSGTAVATRFQLSVLKLLRSDFASTAPYVDRVLDNTAPNVGERRIFALGLARGLKGFPNVIGAVVDGATANLVRSGQGNEEVIDFAAEVLRTRPRGTDAIVAGALSNAASGSNLAALAVQIASEGRVTGANKALVASGAIQASTEGVGSSSAADIITALSTGFTGNALINFIGTAAGKNDEIVSQITQFGVDKFQSSPGDLLKLGNAIIKTTAFTRPEAAEVVGRIIASQPGYNATGSAGTSARRNLAGSFAATSRTNFAAAGAAVAGVVEAEFTINNTSSATEQRSNAVSITGGAITKAPRAAGNIAFEVAQYVIPGDTAQFATQLTDASPDNSAGLVAAGVATFNLQNTENITRAVVLQKSARFTISIGNTIARTVDTEGITQVAQALGSLVGTGDDKRIPRATTLSTIAANLTRAINAKPVVTFFRKEFTWKNRVDEIGELAGVLANAALASGQLTTDATRVSTLAAIGNAIYRSVSPRLFINAGNMLADINDVANNVAGSIAQAIFNSSSLTQAEKTALLAEDSRLLASLLRGRRGFAIDAIRAAFAQVREGRGNFETTPVFDPETPVKNL